jgi:hypothetical protein
MSKITLLTTFVFLVPQPKCHALTGKGEVVLLVEGANAPPKITKIVDLIKISSYMHPPQHIYMHPQAMCSPL